MRPGFVGLTACALALSIFHSGCTTGAGQPPRLASQIELERIRDTLRLYAIYLDDARVEDFLDLFAKDSPRSSGVRVSTCPSPP
jgi:hypothetical protein